MPHLGSEHAPRRSLIRPLGRLAEQSQGACRPRRPPAGSAFLLRTAPTSSVPTESSQMAGAARLGKFGAAPGTHVGFEIEPALADVWPLSQLRVGSPAILCVQTNAAAAAT